MRAGMAGWVLGLVVVAILPVLPGLGLTLLISLLPASLLFLLKARLPRGTVCLLCFLSGALIAVAYGVYRGNTLVAGRLPVECNRELVTVEGRVATLPAVTTMADGVRRQRFAFSVRNMAPDHCAGPDSILLSYYGAADILPGQHWRFAARLKHPWGLANPGSFNVQSWFTSTGVQATGSVRGDGEVLSLPQGQGIGLVRLRLAGAIEQAGLTADAAAVLKAITVGDKSGIDHRLWTLCQQLGINHLLVISGLHVAMVSGFCFLLGGIPRFCCQCYGRPMAGRLMPPLAAMGGAVLYSALAGFALPCLRALVMLMVFLSASVIWRRSGAVNGLLIAGFIVLLLQPFATLGTGLWLSFGAVAGLFWVGQWQRRGAGPWRLLRAHGMMAGLMLPAGALWFGGASTVSVLVNLLLVPLVGFFVVPLSLSGAVFELSGWPGASRWLWQVAVWPLARVLTLAEEWTEAQSLFVPLSGGFLVALFSITAVLVMFLPLQWRWRVAVLPLLIPLLLPQRMLPSEPTLHVLDVGQGTSVVFTSGDHVLLYDTGGGNPAGASLAQSVVVPWLRAHGVERLNDFVISHGDFDHSGGAADVLEALPVDRLWLGGGVDNVGRGEHCQSGQGWRWPDGTHFSFLSPNDKQGESSTNDASCVLRIETPRLRVLLPGDIGQARERELIRQWGNVLRSDVLVAGHHGSASSTAQSWLNFVGPEIVVIGAGYASRFGHPHATVLQRLELQGVETHQTALEGAITIQSDTEGGLRVTGWRLEGKTWWK